MAASEGYLRAQVARTGGDWAAAVRDYRDWFGKGAADRLAAENGVSRRTAERWIAKAEGRPSQASTPKPMAQVGMVQRAKMARAARKLRRAQRVWAGAIQVVYSQTKRGEGTRRVDWLRVAESDALQQAIERAAGLLESGDIADAAEALDQGVLDAYGVPEGTLDIEQYLDGFDIDTGD